MNALPPGRTDVETVVVTVIACIPDFGVVIVRTEDDFRYSLTSDTRGLNLPELAEGQKLECVVTRRYPRVLSATVLD